LQFFFCVYLSPVVLHFNANLDKYHREAFASKYPVLSTLLSGCKDRIDAVFYARFLKTTIFPNLNTHASPGTPELLVLSFSLIYFLIDCPVSF